MKFGLILPNTATLANTSAIIAIAEHAEVLGFDTLWTADHLVLPVENETSSPYSKNRPSPDLAILDPAIVLAAVATRTRNIRLGISVYLSALRHPIVAAKLIASLDQISGGRVQLGVGAGWIPEEFETMGVDFLRRGRVLNEHIQAMRTLFKEPRPSFHGEYYQFDNMGFEPKPANPRLPILIGGNTNIARRRAARYGDGWHVINVAAAELELGITDLRAECEKINRDPSEVLVSARAHIQITDTNQANSAPLVGPLPSIFKELRRLEQAGVTHVALWPNHPEELNQETYIEFINELEEKIIKPFNTLL